MASKFARTLIRLTERPSFFLNSLFSTQLSHFRHLCVHFNYLTFLNLSVRFLLVVKAAFVASRMFRLSMFSTGQKSFFFCFTCNSDTRSHTYKLSHVYQLQVWEWHETLATKIQIGKIQPKLPEAHMMCNLE